MSIDKDFVLEALLRWNYLPTQRKAREELPPVFSTSRFTKEAALELDQLKPRKNGYDQIEYRLTRFNSVSRPLSLPHPLAHAKLCLAIYANWEHIEYTSDNPSSFIKPRSHPDGRLIIMDYEPSISKSIRVLGQSFGKRYKVHTDIANCFPSIYSHALPWALVGIDIAKTQTEPTDWFNGIDKAVRRTKRNETQGIAIGPGTSNVVSEIVLARIDENLRQHGFVFIRYIDDYTCHCESEDNAQEFIRHLSIELSRYKLLLNIRKTEVLRLPVPLTLNWITELGNNIPSGESINSYQATHFLDLAVELAAKNPEGSVLKFAIKALTKKKLDIFARRDVLRYAMALSFHNPVLLPLLVSLLDSNCPVSVLEAPDQLNSIIQENARLHRSDGMCWGLYLLFQSKEKIEAKTADDVVNTGDALSILMLYWSGQHTDKIKVFCDNLDKEDLYSLDCYWLLLYQLYYDGVISNPYTDTVFEVLKKHDVSFFAPAGMSQVVIDEFEVLESDQLDTNL